MTSPGSGHRAPTDPTAGTDVGVSLEADVDVSGRLVLYAAQQTRLFGQVAVTAPLVVQVVPHRHRSAQVTRTGSNGVKQPTRGAAQSHDTPIKT